MLANLAILAYLAANCFSVLSNQLLKFFVRNNWLISDKARIFTPEGSFIPISTNQPELYVVIFHTNIITMFVYIIIHFILKQKGRINFTLKETFCTKEEIFQILLFSIPILASSYKLYLAEKMDFNRIEIAAMIKPFCVSMLALVLLKEKFHFFYIPFAVSIVTGFIISNYSVLYLDHFWLLVSFIAIASIGDTTRRYFCVKKSDALQACCVEFSIYFLYGATSLIVLNKFSFSILFNPLTWLISAFTLSHHFSLIFGVKHAPSVTALEFVNFSKVIFTLIFSYLIFSKQPTSLGVIGAVIIGITLVLFNRRLAMEKSFKKEETLQENKNV